MTPTAGNPNVRSLRIVGNPRPKGRGRCPKNGGKPYTPKETKDWEAEVAKQWKAEFGDAKFEGNVAVDMYFDSDGVLVEVYEVQGKSTHRADVDNLAKAILDGLNKVAYSDDAKVLAMYADKLDA